MISSRHVRDEGDDTASMMTRRTLALLALIGACIAGCDGPRGVIENVSLTAPVSAAGYRLAPGDKVKITVFNEPELSGEYQLGDTGNLSLPLVGEMPAAGATAAQLQQRLTRKLSSGFVRSPRVSVDIAAYRPFNVFGEVKNAGQYPFRPGLTVQDAVAMAGGFTYRANSHTAYIRRANSNGEQTVQLDSERVQVMPGDDIRVPERYF
jgi:polysaccharide export outer membrane protein